MTTKLHLMDDRSVIKTVTVGTNLNKAWNDILDAMNDTVESYPCDTYDLNNDEWKWDRNSIRKARNLEPSREIITDFCIINESTGKTKFSIVWHED